MHDIVRETPDHDGSDKQSYDKQNCGGELQLRTVVKLQTELERKSWRQELETDPET